MHSNLHKNTQAQMTISATTKLGRERRADIQARRKNKLMLNALVRIQNPKLYNFQNWAITILFTQICTFVCMLSQPAGNAIYILAATIAANVLILWLTVLMFMHRKRIIDRQFEKPKGEKWLYKKVLDLR